ncbi:MAG: hypothetical protein WCP97_07815 [bacterium]
MQHKNALSLSKKMQLIIGILTLSTFLSSCGGAKTDQAATTTVDATGLKKFEQKKDGFDLNGNSTKIADFTLYYPENFVEMVAPEGLESMFAEPDETKGVYKDGISVFSEPYVKTSAIKLDKTVCDEYAAQYKTAYATAFQVTPEQFTLVSAEAVTKKNPNIGGADTEVCYLAYSFPGSGTTINANFGLYRYSSSGTPLKVVAALYEDASPNIDALKRSVRLFEQK